MDLSGIGTAGAALLTALAVGGGVLFKRGSDSRDAKDTKQAKAAEFEAKKAQDVYDQMAETLTANRTELRAVQADLNTMRDDMGTLWSQLSATRRELDACEAHIAEWHRWADGGAIGPYPTREKAA